MTHAPAIHFPAGTSPVPPRIPWIDAMKGLAILAVLAHHYAETRTGFAARLTDGGIDHSFTHLWYVAHSLTRSVPDAVLICVAGLGYQGVHLFFIAGGFVLAAADAKRLAPLSYGEFLQKRMARLLPPYWIFVCLLAGIGLAEKLLHFYPYWLIGSGKEDFIVNVLLVRNFAEKWVWVFPGALWFVPLLLQLYLLYPAIAYGIKKHSLPALMICGIITIAYRAFAVLALRGVPVGIISAGRATPLLFCLARLFEFAFGIWLARRFAAGTAINAKRMTVLGLTLWLLGVASSCYRVGYVVSDPVLGVGLFLLLLGFARWLANLKYIGSILILCGQKSYSLFLMHLLLVTTSLAWTPGYPLVPGFVLFCLVSFVLAALLDSLVSKIQIRPGIQMRPGIQIRPMGNR